MTTASSPPRLVRTLADMRHHVRMAQALSKRIAFVPTMGALHAGHVSLLEAARTTGDLVVLSIFVNPMQFGPNEDLSRYPQRLEADLGLARNAGVDFVFHPDAHEMYPEGFQTVVEVQALSRPLCGASRPGHFAGVATVILKLFHIVHPHVALFGEKDFQQLQVIRRMVRDLDLPVAIVGRPIVREADGLALSSRNAYLSPEERAQALALFRALSAAQARFVSGVSQPTELLASAEALLRNAPGVRLDYLELRDAESLEPITAIVDRPALLAVAAHVGKTRLIDNVVLLKS